MGTIKINDDAIWIKHIEGNPALQARLASMAPDEVLDLEVDGIVGRWQRMRDGKDGRPTLGIKPVAEMRDVWARLLKRRGQRVPVREVVSADSYLRALRPQLAEWDSAEDEEAFRDL